MKSAAHIAAHAIEKAMDTSRQDTATRHVYDPKTGMVKEYYHDKLVKEFPYKENLPPEKGVY